MSSNLLSNYYNEALEHQFNDENESNTDTELNEFNENYTIYVDDLEYTLHDLKNLDKETREYIIDYIVSDDLEIAESIEEYLSFELNYYVISNNINELKITQSLLKQFHRIMNI